MDTGRQTERPAGTPDPQIYLGADDKGSLGGSLAGKPRSVVLLSGGMDSCVCAALAARDTEAAALHISYGQRTQERERQAFERICDRLGIYPHLVVKNELLAAV